MRAKYLACVLSLFLLLGFSGSVLAVDDNGGAPGDNVVPGYDIDSADVVVYPPDVAEVEEFMNVNLAMESGSGLPGLVVMEFDVDDDTDTGGNVSMVGIFNPCLGGGTHNGKLKKQKGVDIAILLMLRKQNDDASTAWCDGCKGPSGNCNERGPACVACDQDPNCFELGILPCNTGDTNCFVIGNECTVGQDPCMSGPNKCYDLSVPCDDCAISCSFGRVIGEWYATATAFGATGGGPAPQERGRIDMPLPRGTDSDNSDCYTFPWRRIVEATHADLLAASHPKIFDLNAAKDPANLRWQVSTWHQSVTPCTDPNGPCNDLFASMVNCAEVTDVIPNTDHQSGNSSDMASATAGATECQADLNEDKKVSLTDLVTLKSEFGRNDCPSCKKD